MSRPPTLRQKRALDAELGHDRHEDGARECGISVGAFRARLYANPQRPKRPRGRPRTRPKFIPLELIAEI